MAHPFRPFLAVTTVFVLAGPSFAGGTADHPIVPGFERFHADGKADVVGGGKLLLGELNCVSCHQASDPLLTRKQAPVLDQVGGRVRVSFLRKFLRDPHGVKPGTTMPDLLAGDPNREQKVEALVQFLATTGGLKEAMPKPKWVAAGRDLYNKVGCVACHGSRDAAGQPARILPTSVPLGDLKAKYSLPSLAAFLENPHQVRPSGRMPRLLNGEEAHDVAAYLLQGVQVNLSTARGATTYSYYEGSWDKLPDFTRLKPAAAGVGPAFDIGVARESSNFALRFEGYFALEKEGEYRFTLTSDDGSRLYVDDRKVVDNDGTHPPQAVSGPARLARGIHKVTVEFFQAGGGAELSVEISGPGLGRQDLAGRTAGTKAALEKQLAARPRPKKKTEDDLDFQPALAEKGKALFASLGCASCHSLNQGGKGVVSTLKAPALDRLRSEGGCLATTPAKGLPHYHLSAAQKAAVTAALKDRRPLSKEPAAVVARAMTTFNCYACHSRGKVGGPVAELNALFRTTQPEMGDEARIPPPLTGVGAKLRPEYLRQVLDQGERDRPYMLTRMPAFGLANVGRLDEAFAALDKLPAAPAVHFAETPARVKAAGRKLVGDQAFGCIKCHTFAGHKAEGVQGIDMTLMTRRLRRDWFHAYLMDPQKLRPGTRMPAMFPDGKSLLTDVLDGKPATQIESMWVYLQAGGGAQPPVGLQSHSIPLVPQGSAIIYRNFIQGAGPRAIGVGYPEKVHLAFDANGMRLALLWQGAFIDAARHWTDRGAGFEGPLGDNILALPQGATFAFLPKPDAAWPTTAPKEMGYRFRGYRLTPDDRPTFRYTLNDILIEDFPDPLISKEPGLRRVLTLTAKQAPDSLYFRAAVGSKVEALGHGWYRIDGWKMQLEGGAAPRIRRSAGKTELLVPLHFQGGKARLVQTFVW